MSQPHITGIGDKLAYAKPTLLRIGHPKIDVKSRAGSEFTTVGPNQTYRYSPNAS